MDHLWDGAGETKLAGSDAGGLNACIMCALFTITAGTCTSSVLGMTDCPSTIRSRAGQAWLSASFGSTRRCQVNFSGHQPTPHSIVLNPFCKAVALWLLQAGRAGKENKTMCSDTLLLVFVAVPPGRQVWTHSLSNQIYCIAGLISCLYLS